MFGKMTGSCLGQIGDFIDDCVHSCGERGGEVKASVCVQII